jgi:hypothetical protein
VAVLHIKPVAARLDAVDRHLAVVEKRVEQADGVEPPPMAATIASGSRPSAATICSRTSSPITD